MEVIVPAFINWFHRRIWLWLFLIVILYEAYTLYSGQRDTLSDTVRDTVRYGALRIIFLPLWLWLTWHWVLMPNGWPVTPTNRDYWIIGVGVIWAMVELSINYWTAK